MVGAVDQMDVTLGQLFAGLGDNGGEVGGISAHANHICMKDEVNPSGQ